MIVNNFFPCQVHSGRGSGIRGVCVWAKEGEGCEVHEVFVRQSHGNGVQVTQRLGRTPPCAPPGLWVRDGLRCGAQTLPTLAYTLQASCLCVASLTGLVAWLRGGRVSKLQMLWWCSHGNDTHSKLDMQRPKRMYLYIYKKKKELQKINKIKLRANAKKKQKKKKKNTFANFIFNTTYTNIIQLVKL